MSGHRCGTNDPGPCEPMCLDPDCPTCPCRTAAFGVLLADGVAPHRAAWSLNNATAQNFNLDSFAEFALTLRRIIRNLSQPERDAVYLAGVASSGYQVLTTDLNVPPPP